jgi:hypothetical protein
VNDTDPRDTSHDSGAARFRRKMGIETPTHSLSSSAQRSTHHRSGSTGHDPTSSFGAGRDAHRLDPMKATRGRHTQANPGRQIRFETTSGERKEEQDPHENERPFKLVNSPSRARRAISGRKMNERNQPPMCPLIQYGKR